MESNFSVLAKELSMTGKHKFPFVKIKDE